MSGRGWRTVRWGKFVWEIVQEKGCPDHHAGLQVSTCNSYDLCHPG